MATTLAKDKKRASVIDIVALAQRAEQLQAEIDEALNQIVEGDVQTCPGVPSGVLRNMRIVRYFHGYCPCNWARDEAKQHERADT